MANKEMDISEGRYKEKNNPFEKKGLSIETELGISWEIASYPLIYPMLLIIQAHNKQFIQTYITQGFRAIAREFSGKASKS